MLQYFNPFNPQTLFLASLLIPMTIAVLGCDVQDGPAERAGEKIDETAEKIKDEVNDGTN